MEYQIEQEQERFKLKEQAEELQRSGGGAGGKSRKQSLFIDIPRFDEMNVDPLTVHPEFNINKGSETQDGDTDMQDGKILTEEPSSMLDDDGSARIPSGAAVPKDSGLLRPSRSSISLTSLNRHGLKLDLSSLTLDSLDNTKSAIAEPRVSALGGISGIKGVASPVTLAPKSARPRDGDYLAMDLGQLNTFLNSSTDLNIEDLFGDSEMPFPESAVGDGTVGGGGGAASVMESFLSAQNLLGNVKTEGTSMDLLGSTASHANTASAPTAEEKLFEEFGFVEVKNDHQPTASTSATGTNINADLSSLATFDFSNPSAATDTANFNMMDLESQNMDMQRLQQQQRQQFGLDLGLPTSLDGNGQDSKMLDQYLLDGNHNGDVGGSAAGLSNFNFDSLFGGAADGNNTASGMDGTLDFNDLFDDATGSGGKNAE